MRHSAKVTWGAVTTWPKPLSPAGPDTFPGNAIRAVHPNMMYNSSPPSPLPCSVPAMQVGWEALSALARAPATDSFSKPNAHGSPSGPPSCRCTQSPVSRGLGSPVRFPSRQMCSDQSSGEQQNEQEPPQDGCPRDQGPDSGDATAACSCTASPTSRHRHSGQGKARDCAAGAGDRMEKNKIPFPLLCELWVDRTLLMAFLMLAILVCLGSSDASSPAFSGRS